MEAIGQIMELDYDAPLPSQWWFERGDPSVGIFGSEWIHEGCSYVFDGTEEGEVLDNPISWWYEGCGMNRVSHYLFSLACVDCGSITYVVDHDWDPDDQEIGA